MLALCAATDFVTSANEVARRQPLKAKDIAANLIRRDEANRNPQTELGEGGASNLMESLHPGSFGLPRQAGRQRERVGKFLIVNESGASRGASHPGQAPLPAATAAPTGTRRT